jgi:transglycosylase-like protein with SLT domain
MQNLRGSYVHRGDAVRRRRRAKRVLLVVGFMGTAWWVIASRETATASAAVFANEPSGFFSNSTARKLREQLETTKGQLTLVQGQYDRAQKIMHYSTRFDVPAGVAGTVFDASVREGIDPELGFRLVRLESEFNAHAVSKAGAIGLTQLLPSTARLFDHGVTRDSLYDRDTNLRIGFHYLHTLLDQFHGNVRLALLAYNRGDYAVSRDVRAGVNAGNGYDKSVMGNYKGTGTIQ